MTNNVALLAAPACARHFLPFFHVKTPTRLNMSNKLNGRIGNIVKWQGGMLQLPQQGPLKALFPTPKPPRMGA